MSLHLPGVARIGQNCQRSGNRHSAGDPEAAKPLSFHHRGTGHMESPETGKHTITRELPKTFKPKDRSAGKEEAAKERLDQ